jgi:DNA-binding NarL/FixJ family response regulator
MARTVLIVDDHADFRRLVRRMLEADGYEVVGEAEDGRSALAASARLRPDVVLLDVQLPDLDGFEVAEGMADRNGPAVVLTSTRDAADYARRVERSSARGFVAKSELSGDSLAALVG